MLRRGIVTFCLCAHRSCRYSVSPMNAASDFAAQALTDRELAVVRLVVEGMTNRAIAAELHLSTSTVQAHVASGMRKLGARSRTQLAVRALRASIVPLHPDDKTAGS